MDILTSTINWLSTNVLLASIGALCTLLLMLSMLIGIVEWLFGISPIIFRLGVALRQREVMVFGSEGAFSSIKETILDSKIFKEKNIVHIRSNNLCKAKNKTLFLIDWESSKGNYEEIINLRKDHQTAIIIYATHGKISSSELDKIANSPNTTIVNFRGRLLNDLVTSLITSKL